VQLNQTVINLSIQLKRKQTHLVYSTIYSLPLPPVPLSKNNKYSDCSIMSGARRGNVSRLRQASMKTFNPRLIFSQIVAMQCFHYLFLGFFFQINQFLYKKPVTIDRMFTDKYLTIFHTKGWADALAVFLSYAVVGSFLMAIIVEKSKKCLDFSCTLLVVHWVIVCLYDGFPATWDWWIVHIVSMVSMVLLGEYLCAHREMEDIPLLQL
jgi:protein SYS1